LSVVTEGWTSRTMPVNSWPATVGFPGRLNIWCAELVRDLDWGELGIFLRDLAPILQDPYRRCHTMLELFSLGHAPEEPTPRGLAVYPYFHASEQL
jgi:hypothetical protein